MTSQNPGGFRGEGVATDDRKFSCWKNWKNKSRATYWNKTDGLILWFKESL